MFTLLLEVKTEQRPDFYNPAADGFKYHPRTDKGIEQALRKLMEKTNCEWVKDFRVVCFNGKHEYWKKDMKPMFTVDAIGNVEMGESA